ncbi:hypothetical protein AVEN_132364-1 [Araneus ventricosus]|uniref:Uncharacterized protein n=1 Tax=Araneus ventricosus TaxID=182803 RepID=A0A4Y2ARK2_ARAVE|nr:hypothetical protein AVEN_191297-1 [Araneus ventricosus]GBL82400.1 hypothetical protein AVEN_235945-1 [Araneus ventricosus]GBL82438.1 hypothetical protein AVEN_64401-1 [Araneus ventricosus]GBL82446.1 hypothetical protein AVEN_132364-1 [Araneus ventricosus]
MTIHILLAKLKNCSKSSNGKSRATTSPYSPNLALNLGSKHLSGIRLSSNCDVKTAAENWLNGQGRDFYQSGLNKLALRSDKCLNRLGDYVEK